MVCMNSGIAFDSLRSKKARFARVVTGSVAQFVLYFITVAAILAAVGLIYIGISAGWLLLVIATPCLMLALWGGEHGELRNIPADRQITGIDSLLASNLLGMLKPGYTTNDLAMAAIRTQQGGFFVARFGLHDMFFHEIIEESQLALGPVWQEAERIRQQLSQPQITSIMVLVAIARIVPNSATYLARYQIDGDDLVKGVAWYFHLEELIKRHKQRQNDGGIGRDWSFGYTPLLSRFAVNISEQISYGGILSRDVESHQRIAERIITIFSQGGRQNAALIGPLGSGKTTLVHTLAERLLFAGHGAIPKHLRFQQIFTLDPSSLIAQAHGRGELEGLVQQLFYEAHTAKNIILFLDDAHLFFEEGTGSVDLSNVLLPILEGGALRIILAMDEQHWLRIAQQNSALAQYINRVPVASANQEETMLIMEDQLVLIEHRQKAVYMYQAMQEAYRLSDRYIRDQAMPGKALMLLESAAGFSQGLVTPQDVRQAIEQTVGVKVGTADTNEERQTLLNLEDLIHERMINQTRAVQVVSDALRRARAGVRNQDRPIGTFLFLGPTGVGKTELSKALAAVFFGGEDRMVRIDLNEYVQPNDVARLIADAATDSHSLTAQIARQPFSVVLLDEIEKAHPNVLNTLLQLLDEGILRDINNREVSFRDAIIIATSNAGADRIRQYIEAGWKMEDFERKFTDELINSNQFRPEFLNRFDEIVLFRPLNQEELLQVIDLILKGINKTLATQKVSINVTEDAKRLLVQSGYDPRMGARPMRRIVQRAVENIVAKRMLGGQVAPGSQMEITLADVQAALGQEAKSDMPQPPTPDREVSVPLH